MELARARQIIETTSPDTVNQYLRFGWKLVNQYALEPREGIPARINFVLASFRALEDTRQVVTLEDTHEVNAHLKLGWRLIDKYVTQGSIDGPRHESVKFVLSWMTDEPPQVPGMDDIRPAVSDSTMFDDLGDFNKLPVMKEEHTGSSSSGQCQ
jgi:hypothetical protein